MLLLVAGAGTEAAAVVIMGTEPESNIPDCPEDKDAPSDILLVSDGDNVVELRVELETVLLLVSGNAVACSPTVS